MDKKLIFCRYGDSYGDGVDNIKMLMMKSVELETDLFLHTRAHLTSHRASTKPESLGFKVQLLRFYYPC
jgi:hypothetical protein